ncbi:hypothetical protein Fmac_020185 [Flemingia macrophylla]|uniref:Homeobox domain-containing protein n=1 Tax=Flemingia macrophylla TaxID=520843 RepID=A0ABD1LTA3_9FABA
MGRPASNGAPAFRFIHAEVAEMEAILQEHNNAMPARNVLTTLAEKFSESPDRKGKITIQMKQVSNWFQNKRHAIRSKSRQLLQDYSAPVRSVPQQPTAASTPGRMYDVGAFLSYRSLENSDPEVLVRFPAFQPGEEEWINIRKHVRPRSLPCVPSDCVLVIPGDLVLCFQEDKEQALYFDAHVLDVQRRRHDVRGCRCRFLVRYYHDQSEEILPLLKICRRPETNYRLQQLHVVNEAAPLTNTDVQAGNFMVTPGSAPFTNIITTSSVPEVSSQPQNMVERK